MLSKLIDVSLILPQISGHESEFISKICSLGAQAHLLGPSLLVIAPTQEIIDLVSEKLADPNFISFKLPSPKRSFSRNFDLAPILPFILGNETEFVRNLTTREGVPINWNKKKSPTTFSVTCDSQEALETFSSAFDQIVTTPNLLLDRNLLTASANRTFDITPIYPHLISRAGVLEWFCLKFRVKGKLLQFKDKQLLQAQASSIKAMNEFQEKLSLYLSDLPRLPREISLRSEQRIHIFVDSSNILIPVEYNLDIPAMMSLVTGLRTVERHVVVGSIDPRFDLNWSLWGTSDVRLLQRVRNANGRQREQAVDDVLHAAMLNDISGGFQNRTLVLMSGDGNDNDGRTSFPVAVERALRNGWRVELWAWRISINQVYRDFAHAYPSHFLICHLDDHAEAFLPGFPNTVPGRNIQGKISKSPYQRAQSAPRGGGNVSTKKETSNNRENLANPAGEIFSRTRAQSPSPALWRETEVKPPPPPPPPPAPPKKKTTIPPQETKRELPPPPPPPSPPRVPSRQPSSFIPNHEMLKCPLSKALMTDPVTSPYGDTFERAFIEAHLAVSSHCPIRNQPLEKHQLRPNRVIRNFLDRLNSTR